MSVNGLERMTDRILAEARERREAILEQARVRCQAISEDNAKRAEEIRRRLAQEAEEEASAADIITDTITIIITDTDLFGDLVAPTDTTEAAVALADFSVCLCSP